MYLIPHLNVSVCLGCCTNVSMGVHKHYLHALAWGYIQINPPATAYSGHPEICLYNFAASVKTNFIKMSSTAVAKENIGSNTVRNESNDVSKCTRFLNGKCSRDYPNSFSLKNWWKWIKSSLAWSTLMQSERSFTSHILRFKRLYITVSSERHSSKITVIKFARKKFGLPLFTSAS